MNNKEIGQRIRNIRLALKLSQADVAEKVGIKQESYRKYETGETNLIGRHLESIANVLDTDIIGLLSTYDFSQRIRVLEDDIRAQYELKLKEEQEKVTKLERIIKDKELIISLMQDKIDLQQKELQKKSFPL